MSTIKPVGIVLDGEDYHHLVGSGPKNTGGVAKRTGLGKTEMQLGKYSIELKEALYYSRFGTGVMLLQKLYYEAAGIIFCVGPTDGSNLRQLKAALQKQTSERFLRQAPILIFYNYTAASGIWSPDELGRRLDIDSIGTDNEWKVFPWRTNLLDESQAGFNWLEQALDRYFATVPAEYRAFKNHPSLKPRNTTQPHHHQTDPVAQEQVQKELRTSTDTTPGSSLSYEDPSRVSWCSII